MRAFLQSFLFLPRFKLTTILVAMMAVALVGAVSLQIFLLRGTLESQEVEFDKNVARSLHAIAKSLEIVDARATIQPNDLPNSVFSRVETYYLNPDDTVQIPVNDALETLSAQEIWEQRKDYQNLTIRKTQEGRFVLQIQTVGKEHFTEQYSSFQQTMGNVMLRNFRRMLPLEQRFDFLLVDSIIKAELRNRGISTPFSFAIYDNGLPTTLITEGYEPERDDYKISLFPDDFFAGNKFLLLHFPKKISYINNQMWFVWVLMVVFLAGISAVFGFTLMQMQKQKKISQIKTDFINNMTHEFKTPIATISLAVDALNNPKIQSDPQKFTGYTRIIKQESKRMNAQVEQVLKMSLLDKNELDLHLEILDIKSLVSRAVDHVALQIEERQGNIAFDADLGQIFVMADELQLTSVFTNILDNANKYSPEAPEISVQIKRLAAHVLVAISDKGLGMSKEEQQQVFERFYRANTGDVHNIKGHGLGLSFVMEMVQAHQGKVWVESAPGKGATFFVQLPITQQNNTA